MRNMGKSKGFKILVIILVLLIVVAAVLLGMKVWKDKQSTNEVAVNMEEENIVDPEPEPEKQVQIFQGVERPIAVMIDNHKSAMPQAGLNDAYMVYEMIVEGGETRLMLLLKGKDLDKVGPIRSARHYFLDYALENDAIYVHYGWSPQAQSDIPKMGVNNINGIFYSTESFWRVKDKSAPHNAVTSTANIKEIAKEKDYSLASNKKSVLNYTTEEVTLEESELVAQTVTIPYSVYNTVRYEYDAEAGRYTRYSRDKKQVDWDTEEVVTTKNIIITFVKNTTLNDGENKDRQTLYNTGEKEGYYITNGKAIKITCTKDSRSAQTVYKDENGNEIEVNDGNTFMQICPIDADVTFE